LSWLIVPLSPRDGHAQNAQPIGSRSVMSDSPLLLLPRTWAALACALGAAACTTLAPLPSPLDASGECTRWFAQLDGAVDAAGVRDAQDERVPGFAFVRVDRIGAALRETTAFAPWLERAAALDREGREVELANLPAGAFPIDGALDAAAARSRSAACRDALSQRLREVPALQRALLERATVPDRYATWQRAIGAYPVMRWPFFAGVQGWEREHERDMARWAAQAPPRQRFVPPADDRDAPVFEIELHDGAALAAFDRFGVPQLSGGAPTVDSSRPLVYRRDTQTLWDGRWLRQAVYTLWFPERPKSGGFDLLGGALDGVIVRVTFAADGRPLLLDTIHACGCYHLFFPAEGVTLRAGAPEHEEWAFVAGALPALATGERLVVRIAARTHYVSGVSSAGSTDGAGTSYALRPEDELRSLPAPGGGRRSLYRANGLVAGSERGERFLFWPMGIASAGAMRQWGHHATAFVGRRHFDDPSLLEQRFVLPGGPPP
jgi:hypothetical protein